jgi:hypothetical protein
MGTRISALALIAAAAISETDSLALVDMDASPKVTYRVSIAELRTALTTPGTDGGDVLGTASLRWADLQVKKSTIATGTITTSTPLISATQTWNAGGVTFSAITVNVTDSASAAGSLIADLQVGGASKWKVDKTGAVTQAAGLTVSAGTTALQALTATTGTFSSSVQVGSTGNIAWTSRSSMTSPSDGVITLYNSGGTTFDRLQFGGTTASFPALQRSGTTLIAALADLSTYAPFTAHTLTAAVGGLSVTAGGINVVAGSTALQALTATTGAFSSAITASGNVTSTAGNMVSLSMVAAAGGTFAFTSRGGLTGVGDGIFTLSNNATTDFGRLQFGGTTSSFPALRRTAATLDVVLADVSNWATLNVGSLTTQIGGITVVSGTSSLQALTATTGTFTGNISQSSNNTFLQGLTTGAAPVNLIGVDALNRLNIDANQLGVLFGGAITVSQGITVSSGTSALRALTATTGTFSTSLTVSAGTTAVQALTATTGTFSTGLTVSSGTSAVQALTATTGTFSSTLSGAGLISSADLAIGASNYIAWSGRSALKSSADGIITLFNNPLNDFSRLTFGGITASFPALRRTAATLDVVLADVSNWATLNVGSLTTQTGGITVASGLTVSAGTTAVQALTATTATFSDLLTTVASGSGGAGFRLTPGSGPASPGEGDMFCTNAGGIPNVQIYLAGALRSFTLT